MGGPVLPQARAAVGVKGLSEAADLILLAILMAVPDGADRLLRGCRPLFAYATRHAKRTQAGSVDPAV